MQEPRQKPFNSGENYEYQCRNENSVYPCERITPVPLPRNPNSFPDGYFAERSRKRRFERAECELERTEHFCVSMRRSRQAYLFSGLYCWPMALILHHYLEGRSLSLIARRISQARSSLI